MNDKNIIHVSIYDPTSGNFLFKQKANEKSVLTIFSCSDSNSCDAFKNGTCINVGNAFGSKCPIGKATKQRGYTKRANGFYKQIKGWKEKYSQTLNALKSAPQRITNVPGGWMFPYSFINLSEKIPFQSTGGLFSNGTPFITNDVLNSNIIKNILSQRPQAMMGGEITDYRKKVVPKIIMDIKEYYPDLFNDIPDDFISTFIDSYSYKGRTAYIHTIKPNVNVTISKDVWFWDGRKLSSTNRKFMIFEPCKWEKCYAEFTPKAGETIKIESNDQVISTTKFSD